MSEKAKLLNDIGFTDDDLDVSSLSSKDFENENLYTEIFEITDTFKQELKIIEISNWAKELNCKVMFDKLLAAFKKSLSDITKDFPDWYIPKNTVNEVAFCKVFNEKYNFKFIEGKFYNIGGEYETEKIKSEIQEIISTHITTNISQKTLSILNALKSMCLCERPPLNENVIHTLNGTITLLEDNSIGFDANRTFTFNRLNVNYDAASPEPEVWLKFLAELFHAEDIPTVQ